MLYEIRIIIMLVDPSSKQVKYIKVKKETIKKGKKKRDQSIRQSIKLDKCNKSKEGDRKRKLPKSWRKRSRVK